MKDVRPAPANPFEPSNGEGSRAHFSRETRKKTVNGTRVVGILPVRQTTFLAPGAPIQPWIGARVLVLNQSVRSKTMHRHLAVPVLIAAVSLGSACGRSEPAPATTAPPAAAAPPPPSAPAVGIYVTNETSGELSIIDAATRAVVATVKLGKRPRGIAVSPDRTTLFVALSGSPNAPPGVDEKTLPPPDRSADGIGVIDLRQQKLLKVLQSGTDPEQVAVSPDGTQIYVANEDAGQATVIDIASGKIVETFKTGGEPEGVAVEPVTHRVWVTSEEDGAVYVIDPAAHKVVKAVKVGPRPRSTAFLPDGSRAYIPSETGATLTVVDTRRLAVVTTIKLEAGMRPMGTVMAPDGRSLYVSAGRSKVVLVVDTATNKVVGSVEAGPRPWGIALSGDGKTIFTANGPSNDVSVIDVATKQVTAKVPVGQGPWGVVVVERP
jgi:YVTN family beta-propeller protein